MEETTVFRVEVWSPDPDGGPAPLPRNRADFTGRNCCREVRLFFIRGRLSPETARQLAAELLVDPVVETFAVSPLDSFFSPLQAEHTIEVTLLPGVTDPAAENLLRSARLLGIDGIDAAATGRRYLLDGSLQADELRELAGRVFSNPVIQRFEVDRPIAPPFIEYETAQGGHAEIVPLREADADELLTLSKARCLALNPAEMQAVQGYFRQEGRDPTDVELEMLAQTWSEHCGHKTFKAEVHYTGPLPGSDSAKPVEQVIDGLFNTYIRGATERLLKPWIRSVFVDNAGIVAFDDAYDLAFKVETHNHPSAIEPFGGANTGVGGVVRDILGVSARPIANTDVLCFGPPDLPQEDLTPGTLHPRRIAEGVVHGVEDYGNKMGIPTVNGAVLYHEGYAANPLVFCGCLGLLPRDSHPAEAHPGDLIVVIGGGTGRDGLHGATFSSMEMDHATSQTLGSAVQIGHPINEKQVQEVVIRTRDERLYSAITDCGAGGLSSAVGEMSRRTGARVQIDTVPLKYPGLRPWEIWLSEAQERMVFAVEPGNWPRFQAICAGQNVPATRIGTFEATGRIRLFYGETCVGDIDLDFLHDSTPRRSLEAVWSPPSFIEEIPSEADDLTPALLALLAHPDIRSKEAIIRRYDHEVQGGTAVKPLAGVDDHGPSDAAVLVPQHPLAPIPYPTEGGGASHRPVSPSLLVGEGVRGWGELSGPRGVALSVGICPLYTDLDPYAMAWAAVDEALRNAVAVGADPDQVALLDNFCWGSPDLPDRMGSLVRCAQGCYDAALAYGAPFVSGKDSLYNEFADITGQRRSIPGTLLISALGIVPDVAKTVTLDLKRSGDLLYLVGETRRELGGSHYALITDSRYATCPQPVRDAILRLRALHHALQQGLVQACHDCSEGGLGVALAEMCIAGRIGAEVELSRVPGLWNSARDDEVLFAESLCRFMVEVKPEDTPAFEALFAGMPCARIGMVTGDDLRIVRRAGTSAVSVTVDELEWAWRGENLTPRPPLPAKSAGIIIHFVERGSKVELLVPPLHAVERGLGGEVPFLLARPKVLILHANGTNRDHEAAAACALAGGDPEIVHVNQLIAGERRVGDYHMLVLPGGFSYGDDLGAGKLWALDVRHRLGDAMQRYVESGRPVLGICNGFQALVKSGLLPGSIFVNGSGQSPVTLAANESGRFECRWVYLRPNPASASLFTQGLDDLIACPVAHGEGRLAASSEAVLADLQAQGLIALTYVEANGAPANYPGNPNGSALGIAGLCNPAGNVLGLMPHPEDHLFPWQHPRWHRGESGMSGLKLFENGLKYA